MDKLLSAIHKGILKGINEHSVNILADIDDDISDNTIAVKDINSKTNVDALYHNNFEYVDLGLPSGIKWAKCNVGATHDYLYGYCFSWGETEYKYRYENSTYKYAEEEIIHTTVRGFACELKSYKMTKYNKDDGLSKLELTDDAARENMQGRWCLPTVKDFNELLEHTTVQWLENYKGRTAGCLFTSKQNGNTLFLPAAGYIEGDGVFSDEETGYYWTADVCPYDDNTAWYLKFIGAHLQMRTHYRIHGCTVRAVLK